MYAILSMHIRAGQIRRLALIGLLFVTLDTMHQLYPSNACRSERFCYQHNLVHVCNRLETHLINNFLIFFFYNFFLQMGMGVERIIVCSFFEVSLKKKKVNQY